jgi:hypothetical protein
MIAQTFNKGVRDFNALLNLSLIVLCLLNILSTERG